MIKKLTIIPNIVTFMVLLSCQTVDTGITVDKNKPSFIICAVNLDKNSVDIFIKNDEVQRMELKNSVEYMIPYYDGKHLLVQNKDEIVDAISGNEYETKSILEKYNSYPIFGKSEGDYYFLFNEGYLEQGYATGVRHLNLANGKLNEFHIFYDIFVHSGDVYGDDAYVIGLDLDDEKNVLLGKINLTEQHFEVIKVFADEELRNTEMNFLKFYNDQIIFVNPLGALEVYDSDGKLLKENELGGSYTYSYSVNTPYLENEEELVYVGNKGDILKINKQDLSITEFSSELPLLNYEETYSSLTVDNNHLYFINLQKQVIEKYSLKDGKYEGEIPLDNSIEEALEKKNTFVRYFSIINGDW